MRSLSLIIAPLLLVAAPAHAELAPAEKRMVSAADAGSERDIALLERLVAQNSGTRNVEGVKKVRDMLLPEFAALGFETRWIPMDAVNRAGHLIATHAGKPGTTRMLLIGHLDTVFEPSSPFQSVKREGDMLHGPGAADDKGGVVVMLAALRAMQAAGTLDGANIVVALTGDEEAAGEPVDVARADLVDLARKADVALDFEGLVVIDGQDFGSVARRSSREYTIRTSGRSAHSSGIFSDSVGSGAVFEMARIVDAFRTELPEANLTFNIGLIGGGATTELSDDDAEVHATGKTNIVPPIAIARGDYRGLTQDQVDRTEAKMKAIVARHLPKTDATITFKDGYPPMSPTPGNQALLDRLNAVNADLGLDAMPALDPLKRGAGDISFVAKYVDGLAGLGPSSSGDHTPEERVDLASFPRQIKRAAILMTRLSQAPAPAD
ncbi:M20/M25/M40 family metallo-hydrolase [Novosphingobium aquimarinum]|uniref:M20/M25/M40 family metallo-hydrolase n=1 Tax=Novosphingobium aquimarinum TaxID=2682494 RepID=UPI0012EC7DD4|nr:M20/M25/M40 family metallo-hydrolase [Novosphingobium aquimarinum]